MLSVVIPTYNEEDTVVSTVKNVVNELEGFVEYEVIVVNDGSTDASLERLLATSLPKLKVITHVENAGYGKSLYDGILAARYENVAILDADGTYPVSQLKVLLSYLPAYDMAVGARTGQEFRRGFLKHPARRIFRFLVEYATGQRIPDVNSGFRVLKRDILLSFKEFLSTGFSFTTSLTLLFMLNLHYVKYVPVEYFKRSGKSKSKVKLTRDTLRAGQIIVATILYFNPIKLFLLLATGNLAVGAAIVLVDLLFLHNLVFQVAGAIMLASFIPVFSLGLLAEQVRRSVMPVRK